MIIVIQQNSKKLKLPNLIMIRSEFKYKSEIYILEIIMKLDNEIRQMNVD